LKNFYFSEQKFVELRASAFNVANRHTIGGNAGAINTNLDNATFGMITNPQTNNPRSVQLGLKIVF
jgi:hypothetical protein